MKNILNKYRAKYISSLYNLILSLWLLFNYSCETPIQTNGNSRPVNDEMIVCRNHGNKLTYVNQYTFELIKSVSINIPDSLQIHSKCLSTNKDYLICIGSPDTPPFRSYIMVYDITNDSVTSIFPTGLDSVGAPRLTAANILEEPGLIYLSSHEVGLYYINFLKKNISQISSELEVDKEFFHSPDKKNLAILKTIFRVSEPGYSETEIYNTSSRLKNIELILNENNIDGIQIIDLKFSENNKIIYISFRDPEKRGVEKYFGSYNLETKQLYKSFLTFPWSVNPNYIAYSSKRKEVYLVGREDKFYVIDISTKDYKIKEIVDLPGKVPSPSRILVRDDQNIAFVSCVYSDLVFSVDLENKNILKTIEIEKPYWMFPL